MSIFSNSNFDKKDLSVKRVFVRNCCGSWCVWLENKGGDQTRIATFDILTDDNDAQEKAEAVAEEVREFFGLKKGGDD